MAATENFYREEAKQGSFAQRELCPQPKEFYREGAKDAKLREGQIKSCFFLRATSRPSRLRGSAFEDGPWSDEAA
jgi:hypothetical protein